MRSVPKWPDGAMQTLLLAPSVELIWGHDHREGCVEMWPEAAMRTLLRAPSAELLWGHDPGERCQNGVCQNVAVPRP
eukprot:3464493-Pyramimonas_sp.AAC.1